MLRKWILIFCSDALALANTMFRECFQKIEDTGSNRDWGVDKDARLYFNLSTPGNFVGTELHNPQHPSFNDPQNPPQH
jgi:Mn-containing catalase